MIRNICGLRLIAQQQFTFCLFFILNKNPKNSHIIKNNERIEKKNTNLILLNQYFNLMFLEILLMKCSFFKS